ncbi:hypothetical protein [Runella sp.]|uniref:hypothetical protein n=1 Tax=Runella sp. TaxID=1960881 RepID=UPI003D14A9EC
MITQPNTEYTAASNEDSHFLDMPWSVKVNLLIRHCKTLQSRLDLKGYERQEIEIADLKSDIEILQKRLAEAKGTDDKKLNQLIKENEQLTKDLQLVRSKLRNTTESKIQGVSKRGADVITLSKIFCKHHDLKDQYGAFLAFVFKGKNPNDFFKENASKPVETDLKITSDQEEALLDALRALTLVGSNKSKFVELHEDDKAWYYERAGLIQSLIETINKRHEVDVINIKI